MSNYKMHLIAGADLYASLEAEKQALVDKTPSGHYKSNALCAVQSAQARRGILGARLIKSIYGWTVRYDSGLQDFGIIAGPRQGNLDGTLAAAEAFAKAWVAEAPQQRYVWVYADELATAEA